MIVKPLGPKKASIVTLTTLACPTQTLLDSARALCDWILAADQNECPANVDLMLHAEKMQLTHALREMVHSRAAELNALDTRGRAI